MEQNSKKRSSYTLSKADLIENVYNKIGYNKKQTEQIVSSFFDIIKDSLKQGSQVKISRFGKFFQKNKKERQGRNPKTGEPVVISARKVTLFHPSPYLKKIIQE